MLVEGAFAFGLLVPLAIARGWAVRRLAQPIGVPAWAGAVLLLLRGYARVIDDLTQVTGILANGITGLSTEQTAGITSAYAQWSGRAVDVCFLAGGMIFTWPAVRHRRQSSHSFG